MWYNTNKKRRFLAMDFQKTVVGIELGSTKIKAVLLNADHKVIASGGFDWENRLENGLWTYSLEDIHKGLRTCFAALSQDVREKFGVPLTVTGGIGVSAMMHGYLAVDKEGNFLVPFRTWRNTVTGPASRALTERFGHVIAQRWSFAHLYQAILNGEEHVPHIGYLTTLASYITFKLTGNMVVGLNEASGMLAVDSKTLDFDSRMLDSFDALIADKGFPWKIRDILPKALNAGEIAGILTEEGARFLDPTGNLQAGIPLAPPEGDAGTGLVATNTVRVNTGNVSAGTSCFAMLVTDQKIPLHKELNMFATPAGKPVVLVHEGNCTSDINAWIDLFSQVDKVMGGDGNKEKLYPILFRKALEGEPDCGGLLSYNYFSGEGVTGVDEGRPVFLRMPDSRFTIENFMRMHLMSAISTLKWGMDILTSEGVEVKELTGHGGYFRQKGVGQRILSAAINAPVKVMENAAVGGPYGMALLAAYTVWREDGESLEDYLDNKAFKDVQFTSVMADPAEVEGFARFLASYRKAFPVEKAAVETFSR